MARPYTAAPIFGALGSVIAFEHRDDHGYLRLDRLIRTQPRRARAQTG
jgi:hypothetical protein